MFFLKSKLDLNLRYALENNLYKTYRVNLHCRNLLENIEKKLVSYNGELMRSIPNIGIICAELSPKAIERLMEYPDGALAVFYKKLPDLIETLKTKRAKNE